MLLLLFVVVDVDDVVVDDVVDDDDDVVDDVDVGVSGMDGLGIVEVVHYNIRLYVYVKEFAYHHKPYCYSYYCYSCYSFKVFIDEAIKAIYCG